MKKYAYLLLIVGFIFNTYTFTSCVSAKKYQALEAEHQKTIIEEKGAKNQLDREKATLEQYEKTIAGLKADNNKLSEEVMNRANAGSTDIQTLQKKVKYSNDSLAAYKEFYYEEKNRWQNGHDSLEHINAKLKDENKNLIVDINKQKIIWTEKIERLEDDAKKSIERQRELTIAVKNANDEKEIILKELTQLKSEKNSQINSNPENNVVDNSNKNELGKDLAYYFLNYEPENARVFNEKGSYVIEIDEHFLFGMNGRISEKGGDILNDSKNIIKKYKEKETHLIVETTGTGAEDRPHKAELVRKHLADNGLNASSSPKNFTPIAFDTSKESIRKTKIYIK